MEINKTTEQKVDSKSEPTEELNKYKKAWEEIAYFIEPHWRGAGEEEGGNWLFESIKNDVEEKDIALEVLGKILAHIKNKLSEEDFDYVAKVLESAIFK
jgi:signal recognition particle GTPase